MSSYAQKLRTTFIFLSIISMALIGGGCARYARNVNVLYEPVASVRGGSGDVYITIPEPGQPRSREIKWIIGKVNDGDKKKIDDVLSPRSPAEIILAAFTQEFRLAGYTIIPTTKLPEAGQRVVELTKAEIELNQTSGLADIEVKCRVVAGLDVHKDGKLIKRLQYEASSSRLDVKDRDLLAAAVLRDALQSIMRKAMPELHSLLK